MSQKKFLKSPVAYGEKEISLAAARALKALQSGTASEDQQKRALSWILYQAGGLMKEVYMPGDHDAAIYLAGRRSVPLQILHVLETPVEEFRKPGETDA